MALLDIIISDNQTTWLIITIGVVLLIGYSSFRSLKKQRDKFQQDDNNNQNKLKEQELMMQKKESDLKVVYQNWAYDELKKFKETEILRIQKAAEEQSLKAASVLLQEWKFENESKIRQDAIKRSYSVNLGLISEQLIPFHAKFPFNPKDARFLGMPIDLIVFDGLYEGKDEINLYVVEIKTGNSKLTDTQKKIKHAIYNKNVHWHEINYDDFVESDKETSEGIKNENIIGQEKLNKGTIKKDMSEVFETIKDLIDKGIEDMEGVKDVLEKLPAYERLKNNADFDMIEFDRRLKITLVTNSLLIKDNNKPK
ncbi:MAG TPA: Holliday junction resolvase-like protein [Bacteroidia bacterium]|nr:Holliday junction resolvase-like protein [Bacteroidia bacterium]